MGTLGAAKGVRTAGTVMKILTLATTMVLLAPAALPVGAFDLRPPDSRVEFVVKDNRGGFTGETREVSGTVTVRERDGGYAADVEVKVDARTIRTGATLRDAQMRSPAFLNTTAFPFITFSGTVTVGGPAPPQFKGAAPRATQGRARSHPESRGAVDPRTYAREQRSRFLEDLKSLIRIPSVSTLPEYHPDLRRAAQWLEQRLRALDLRAWIIESDSHPIVYGEWMGAPGRPTLLCYGHYDVQPPDPLDEWESPPFEPTVRGDNLYARGASDDKGQLMIQICAVESWLRTAGRLPVNVKFFIEGEEELGSPRVKGFIPKNKRLLRADVSLVCDGSFFASEVPALVTGLRGLG